MSIETHPDGAPETGLKKGFRTVGRIVCWVIGVLWILLGVIGLAADRSTGAVFTGLGFVLSGAIILPPLVQLLRTRLSILKSISAPPLASIVIFFACLITGSVIAAGGEKTPEKAAQEARQDAGSYARRLDRDVVPDLERLKTIGPLSERDITRNLEIMDEAASALRDGQAFAADPAVGPALARATGLLASKQTEALPLMRENYATTKAASMADGVKIETSGRNSRTVRFTGEAFSSYSGVGGVHESSVEVLRKLRFQRVEYAPPTGRGETFFDLKTPDDAVIGRWSEAGFEETPAPKP